MRIYLVSNSPPRSSGAARFMPAVAVVALLKAVSAAPAGAQTPEITRSADCLPRASRVQDSCDPKQVVVRSEREVEFSIEVPPPARVQCVATIEIAYTQRDDQVGVEGVIANNVCGASSGEYKLMVSVRSEDRGLQLLEFIESWERQDDEAVKIAAAFPIGENVDLVRVRTTQVRCTCADAPDESNAAVAEDGIVPSR